MIDRYIKEWLIKAIGDLKVAEHELNLPKDEMITSAVCFHSQQAAEKMLKAFLISRNIEFEKVHDLKYLLELCTRQDIEFRTLTVEKLSFYAVEVRYPDDFYIPSVTEAKKCFETTLKIKNFVFKKLGVKDKDLKNKHKKSE